MVNEAMICALVAITAAYDWRLGNKWSSGFKTGVAFAGALYLIAKYGGA